MSTFNTQLEHYISISVSEDKLKAYIQFSNYDEEQFAVSEQQLENLLQKNSIVHGINYNQLSEIATDPKSYFYSNTVIANGDKPVDGKNGMIKYLFDLENNAKKPMELEDGKVDYKEVITLRNVQKGQLIGQRFLATEGTPGKSVIGETLPAKAGNEARFKIGKNVVLDAEQMSLYSAIDGMFTVTDRDKVNVFPIFEVNGDVDFHTGNIDFVGTVVIRGNVRPGFRIKASGDIRIIGGVEAAELDAEGSIEISAGILGHNKAKVKAGKNVKSSFIQDAYVEAKHDIIVSQSIMHSTIRAGKTVTCTGAKGLIVGGVIQAGESVIGRTIGNSMSTNTIIEVGVLPELRNEMIQLRTQLKLHIENTDKTEKALALLDQLASAGQLTTEKLSMRIKLNHTKKQAHEEQNELKERILEIEKSLEDTEQAKVHALSIVYGGTKIVIGRYTKFIKDPISRMTFHLYDGDIALSAYV